MQIENPGVLELAHVRENMNDIYKVMSTCPRSIQFVESVIAYIDYTMDCCDHMLSIYLQCQYMAIID